VTLRRREAALRKGNSNQAKQKESLAVNMKASLPSAIHKGETKSPRKVCRRGPDETYLFGETR